MQPYPFALTVPPAAGDTPILNVAGNFIRYDEETNGVAAPNNKVQFKTDSGESVTLKPGQSILTERPFSKIDLTNKMGVASLAGTLVIGAGQLNDSNVQGTVTVLATTNNGAHVNTKVTVAAASTLLRAAVAAPRHLLIQVPDTAAQPVWIRTDGGVAVADATAIKLRPGDSYEPAMIPTGQINAISGAGNIDVQITTG